MLLTALVIAVGSALIVFLKGDPATTAATSPPSTQTTNGGSAANVTVQIANYKFAPPSITVKAGTQVTWTNTDSSPHTATSPNAFDTGSLNKGQSKTVTLSKPGTYAYVCQFHPFMHGTVTVQ